ncbi:unnamed protein product [Hydatigera taeniaeformis]|uniref:NUP50 domain-containing protein n=1 Tax=Hydatigena taeniaeformis TaxID=6205 RepID=A0A0R3WRX3_HYDTA|nr:unnamed protein product [Hydatigera taeniaeformis]
MALKKAKKFKYAPKRTGIGLVDDDAGDDRSRRENGETDDGDCPGFVNGTSRFLPPADDAPTPDLTAIELPLAVGNFASKRANERT